MLLKIYVKLLYRLQPEVEPPALEKLLEHPHLLPALIVPLLPASLAVIFAGNRAEVIPPHLHVRAISHLINHQFVELDALHDAYDEVAGHLRTEEKNKRDRDKRRKEIQAELEESKKSFAEAAGKLDALEKELEGMTLPEVSEHDRKKSLEARKKAESDRAGRKSAIKTALAELNLLKRKQSSLELELERLDETDEKAEEKVAWYSRQLNKGRAFGDVRELGKDRYGRVWWWIDLKDQQVEEGSDVEVLDEDSEGEVKERAGRTGSPSEQQTPIQPFGVLIESFNDLDSPPGTPLPSESKYLYFPTFDSLANAVNKLNPRGIRERALKAAIADEFKKRKVAVTPQGSFFGTLQVPERYRRGYQLFLEGVVGNRGEVLAQPGELDVEGLEKRAVDALFEDLREAFPAFDRGELDGVTFESVLRYLADKMQAADPTQVPPHEYKMQINRSLTALNKSEKQVVEAPAEVEESLHETGSVDGDEEPVVVVVERPSLARAPLTTLAELHVWCLRLIDHQNMYMEKIAKGAAKRSGGKNRDPRRKESDRGGAGGRRDAARRAAPAISKDARDDSDSEDELVRGGRPTRSNAMVVDQPVIHVEPGKRVAAARAAQRVADSVNPKLDLGSEDVQELKSGSASDSEASNASFKEKESVSGEEDEKMEEASASESDAGESASEDNSDEEEEEEEGKRRSPRTSAKPARRAPPARTSTRKLKRKSDSSNQEDSDQESEESAAPRRKLVRRRIAISSSDTEEKEDSEDSGRKRKGRKGKSESEEDEEIEDSEEETGSKRAQVGSDSVRSSSRCFADPAFHSRRSAPNAKRLGVKETDS